MKEFEISDDTIKSLAESFLGYRFSDQEKESDKRSPQKGKRQPPKSVVIGGKKFKVCDLGDKNNGLQAADCIHSKSIAEDPKVRNRSRNRS